MSGRQFLSVVLFAGVMLVLVTCGGPASPTPAPATAVAQAAAAVQAAKSQFALTGTEWQMEWMLETPVIPGTAPTVGFGIDRYTGFGGCDWFVGMYAVQGDTLRMQTPAKTVGGCLSEPKAATQQSSYMTVLINTTNYAAENGKLVLYTTGNQRLATLVPLAAVPFEGTTWDLSLYWSANGAYWAPIIPGSKITAKFDGQQMTGTAGCNDYAIKYKLEEKTLTLVGDMTVTGQSCTKPDGVMDQQQAYLTGLQKAAKIDKFPRSLQLLKSDNSPGLMYHADATVEK